MNTVRKLFTILDTETRTCEKHGEYKANLICLRDGDRWSTCEQCQQEKRDAENRAEQERAAIEARRVSIEKRLGNACIPPRFQNKGFENYLADNEGQKRALAKCLRYADQFNENYETGKSLLLLGGVGTGKTHLANAIANKIIREQGRTALYSTVGNVLRLIRSTFNNSDTRELDIYQLFSDPDLLIIDEIGVQKSSEFELTALFDIINDRYENMLPTIIISNHGPSELPNYLGDRVVDRLREGGEAIGFDWTSSRTKEARA
ncbi:AAA family ATPase [Entomomonas moraniae]|uniref:AAA family ATPase n=1 Tax=Entomomonas moraniae TaxID=2213226 RepID=A0A3S9XE94_9GAMM|nr:ATP-binding protein [Entomomonas moraniae]AZS50670.1 AAA family ATPase [Entomomonas moraniae]